MAGRGAARGRRASLGAALAATALALLPVPAGALLDGKLEVFGEAAYTHDSNVFRISGAADPVATIGSAERSDSYRTTTLGLRLDLPVSRQRFQASYAAIDQRYDRFTDLNFTGYDARAQWLWEYGRQLSGKLGASETYQLASLSDFQTRVRNPLRITQAFGEAAYLLTPRWKLQGGLAGLRQANGDPGRVAEDVEVASGDLAVLYVSRAGNSIGPGVGVEDGRFPNPQLLGATLVDNGYTQYRAHLLLDWTITAASRVKARAGVVQRRHDQLAQRDHDMGAARIEYEWKPRTRLVIVALAQHDISSTEDIRTSFVRVTGVSLRPTWTITEKLALSGALETAERRYLGDAAVALGLAPQRDERVRSAGLGLEWKPERFATLSVSALHEERSSSIALGDYRANVVRAAARLAF